MNVSKNAVPVGATVLVSAAIAFGAFFTIQHYVTPAAAAASYVQSHAKSTAIQLATKAEQAERAQQDPINRSIWLCSQGGALQCANSLPAALHAAPYRAINMVENAEAWASWALAWLRWIAPHKSPTR